MSQTSLHTVLGTDSGGNPVFREVVAVVNLDGSAVSGGGVGGGSSVDRELVVSTYRCKIAFTGASVGDTITATQVIDVSGATPSTVSTVWRNQTAAADLASAPAASNLELTGSAALTDAQLRASPISVRANNNVALSASNTSTTQLAAAPLMFHETCLRWYMRASPSRPRVPTQASMCKSSITHQAKSAHKVTATAA